MKKNKLIITLFCLISLIGFSGCEDWLHVNSDNEKLVGESFKNIDDLRSATAYLYCRPWYYFNNHVRIVTEARAGNAYVDGITGALPSLALFSENSNLSELYNAWGGLYSSVTHADYVINDYVSLALENGVDETAVRACEAEARFMRGTAYWYLAMLWHDVPIIDNPRDYMLNTIIPPNPFEDVLQYAIYDLKFASEYMKETDEKGRVTRDAAKAMLSRIYLTAANYAMGDRFTSGYLTRNQVGSNAEIAQIYFSSVKSLTEEVIHNGQYEILEDFEDIYKVQNNNNEEVMFAIQFVQGSVEWGYTNSLNDWAYNKELTNNLNAGGYVFASYDFLRMLVNEGGLSRIRGSVCVPGQKYTYLGTHTAAGSWTVPSDKAKVNFKKFVVGSNEDTGGVAINGNTGLASPMLRMAEVYLMHAEAVLGMDNETSDPTALEYFNKVRERAYYLNADEFVPATKITRNDIFKERRMELFLETVYWTDIKRRSFYDMDWTLNLLNNKHIETDPETDFCNYASYSYTFDPVKYPSTNGWSNSPREQAGFKPQEVVHQVPDGSYVHASGAKSNIWAFAYPSIEVSANSKLNSVPVNYEFQK
ncbi:RagB/SusD family nutrient uptake outer membrane protein [Bacteroides sp. UBA939]|uniref:RagB/SusD family nutrient uptake outer membrane protein n=1 Tax=Bacteroides sp. UBA939 TaxID=1946092 RepID=UPI0025BA0BCD|nr:RagB/SusD family nutrient uptake outer membrane protein [Bacteroides sp. UBA939]